MRESIAASISLGPVALTVADFDQLIEFYHDIVGLRLIQRKGPIARMGVDSIELLTLHKSPDAHRVSPAPGLFHFAILVPTRPALAAVLNHLVEERTPLHGASDHLVSEAIYLADPEGNGIEIYRDRPRSEWKFDASGNLRMTTDPLDARGLLADLPAKTPWDGLPPKTVMGHVHLRVSEVEPAESFYRDVIGLDVTTRYGTSASFLSVGGYHHHLAINTWNSLHANTPPPGALGLKEYQITLPNEIELAKVNRRITAAQCPAEYSGNQTRLSDPSGNVLVLAVNSPT